MLPRPPRTPCSGCRRAARSGRDVKRRVKRVFEAKRGLPDDVYEAPYIGRGISPPRTAGTARQQVVRALIALEWFERTTPEWAKPLPLREAEGVMTLLCRVRGADRLVVRRRLLATVERAGLTTREIRSGA